MKIAAFYYWVRQNRKNVIAIFLISALVTYSLDKTFDYVYSYIQDKFTIKPEIKIFVDRIEDLKTATNLDTSIYQGHSFLFMGSRENCKIRDLIFQGIVKSSEEQSPNYYRSLAGTTLPCKFDDGSPCYYYSLNIKNIGKIPTNSISIDGAILSEKMEYTSDYSPKIQMSSGTGFFRKGGFYLTIPYMEVNETVNILLRASSLSDIILNCNIQNKGSCSYVIDDTKILHLGENDTFSVDNKIFHQPDMQNLSKTELFVWNFGLNRWDILSDSNIQDSC